MFIVIDAECPQQSLYAKCCYAECRYAQCRGAFFELSYITEGTTLIVCTVYTLV